MRVKENDDIDMRTIQFLVTEDCNLNCVYCYEKKKTKQMLPACFIKGKVQEQMLEDNGYKELSIDFFGGEPLIAFDTIKEVVEWFHQVQWPGHAKAYRFAITTNGTLLNEQNKKWFEKYHDVVTLCLSLDGTRDAHNRNRSNSYDMVAQHFEFIRKNWPHQPVKMTISQYTLDQMYEGVVHIHRLGLPVEPNVVFENVWGDVESKKGALRTYAGQLERLVHFYHRNPHLRKPRLINKNLMSLYDRRHPGDNMFCGAGSHLISWSADSREYPCMRFAPISTTRPIQKKLPDDHGVNKSCLKCPFERLCPTCEGHNFEVTGSCYERTDFHCEFLKLEILAAARLFFLEHRDDLLRKDLTVSAEEENINRLRRILAIRTIDDLCRDLIDDWPSLDSSFEPPFIPTPTSLGEGIQGADRAQS